MASGLNEAKHLSHAGTQQKCEHQFLAGCGTVRSLTPHALADFYDVSEREC